MRGLKVILALLTAALISSCITRTESKVSTTPLAPKEIRMLIVLSQGFHSCTKAYKNLLVPVREMMEKQRKVLEQQYNTRVTIKAAYMDICFTGGVIDDWRSEKIFYILTRDTGENTPRREAGPSTIHQIIETVATDMGTPENPTHVYLIGHSHGGWLMLNTALQWQGGADLTRLFTIDPISYARCTQSYIIFNRLMKGLSLAQILVDEECTQFPSDIAPYAKKINDHVSEQWTNFFQFDFRWVHSNRVDGADGNRQLNYSDLEAGDFSHKAILGDPRVWTAVSLQIQGDLVEFAAAQP